MRKILVILVIFFLLAPSISVAQEKREASSEWVRPGDLVYKFPLPITFDPLKYRTTVYYSTCIGSKAILEIRIEANGSFWGYKLNNAPVISLAVELKLRVGHQIIIGDTTNIENSPVRITVTEVRTGGRVKLKIS